MIEKQRFTDYYALILHPDQSYSLIPIKEKEDIGRVKCINLNGVKYHIDTKKIYELKNWIPGKKYSFWNPFRLFLEQRAKRRRVGIFIFQEPVEKIASVPLVIEPCWNKYVAVKEQVPLMTKAYTLNKLWQRYQRKVSYGTPTRLILYFVLILVMVIIAMFFFMR